MFDPRGRLPERAAAADRGADADAPRQRVLEQRRLDDSQHDAAAAFERGHVRHPGTYKFYCLIHPFMNGTVTVQ